MHSKIAICISGQVRTAIEAMPAFSRYFGIDHDVFIHCWDDDQTKINQIKKFYNPVKMIVETPDPVNHNKPFGSMLYSMMVANELKRNNEIKLGYRYDTVIKTRFDIIFNPALVFHRQKSEPRTITCIGLTDGFNNIDYENKGIDDVVFWGDSVAMDIACDAYRRFIKICLPMINLLESGASVDPGDCFFSPGVLIYQTATRRNVMFRNLEGQDFVIFREHAKHLHPIKDYQKIKELCKGWKP
jgi:hypothetical protein